MKNRLSVKLRQLFRAFLPVATLSTGLNSSAFARTKDIPPSDSDRHAKLGAPPTNEILGKDLASTNTIGLNGRINTARMSAISTAAGATLTYKRAQSGNAHRLSLPARFDNDMGHIDQVRLDVAGGAGSSTRDMYLFDVLESRRSTFIGQ